MSTKKKNLDAHLAEIFKQFIALKDDDLKRSQEVFKSVFEEVKKMMGEKDNYFQKYSSQVMYAGSVYDGIKVSKLDEFDMDIVVRLPVSYEQGEHGISLERDQPGFVRMRIANAFDNLDKQPEWEKCHKVTREWRDSNKYFLQNKFRQWMHGIVQKALNEMNGKVTVNGVTYLLKYKESGPAYTLNISHEPGDEPFNLDVDLVPVIRFQHPRWPEGYRQMVGFTVRDWLVVPKPNKAAKDEASKTRSWRLSFQKYEREMMKGCQQLKTTIRLVKKLRDALEMKAIASYYIKTLFLWKVHNEDKKFWQNKLSATFTIMVTELRDAIQKKNIPYFWHEKNNLIEGLKSTLQKVYLDKLNEVVNAIATNDVDKIVGALLTPAEMTDFKKSEFYQKQPSRDAVDSPASVSRQTSKVSSSSTSSVPRELSSTCGSSQSSQQFNNEGNITESLIQLLINKIDGLTDKVISIEDRMSRLERAVLPEKNNLMGEEMLRLTTDTRALQLDDLKKIVNRNLVTITNNDVSKASYSNEQTLIDLDFAAK